MQRRNVIARYLAGPGLHGLTLGAGLQGKLSADLAYLLDYAWADHGRLDSTHRLTMGITF